MSRFVFLAAIALLIAFEPIRANDAEEGAQPVAEPYSFSYSAESTGGFSSREESGDATGHVQGFYIIMGDDQRERRVDYVADKDGYRATISTNEIGTRSQSSADAEYQARLPSKEQLDQAKTTLEEYKFLEQQHEFELKRHLNVQQSGQQQRQSNSNQNTQSWSASGASRQQAGQAGQAGQASWVSSSSGAQQQRWTQSNTNSVRPNQPQLQSQPQQQAQFAVEQATNLTLASSTGQDDEGWRSAKLLAANQQQQQQQLRPRGTTETELASSVTEATSSPFIALTGAGLRQQTSQQQENNFQAPAWQSSSGQASISASAQTQGSGGADLGLQRQFKQQFMQQAQQLAAEDYPRQSQNQNQQIEPNRQVVAGTTFSQQQQPQEELVAPQSPQWQQQANSASDQKSQGQEAFSQINQQQNNIIDEVSGEQVEPNQQQIGGGGQLMRQDGAITSTGQSDVTTGQLQPVPIQPRPEPRQQQQAQQQSYKNYKETTTTAKRPVPTGFLAIDLGRQEVELKPETPGPSYQTSGLANQQVEADQLGGDEKQQDGGQTTDYQQQQFQVDQRQEQQQQQPQPQRPKSIQQIIQSGGTRQQQQTVSVRPTIATTQQPTTTQARQEPELTTTFQPIVTTTSTTTRTPQVETTARTTTTTNSQTYSSFAPSSAAPVERLSTGLLEQTTRKPAFVRQQQQWVNKGTKSGVQGARRLAIGPKYTPSRPIEQPLVVTPSIPTSTTREQFSTTRRPNFLAQSVGTSQQPELVVSGQQTAQQVPFQSFNSKQRQSGPTSERTTSTTSTTVQPAQFETSTPQEAPYQPQTQQQPKPEPRQPIPQQPQWTGVKGAAKTGANKRQFWQQPNGGATPTDSGQRTGSLQASVISSAATQSSQASVDYAPLTREFGSRIQGRSN